MEYLDQMYVVDQVCVGWDYLEKSSGPIPEFCWDLEDGVLSSDIVGIAMSHARIVWFIPTLKLIGLLVKRVESNTFPFLKAAV